MDDHKTSVPFTFDSSIIENALKNIQRRQLNTKTQIDQGLFSEVNRILSSGIDIACGDDDRIDGGFKQDLQTNTEVFAAFKAHRMGRDMASQLLDADGNVKPFRQFKKDTEGIVSHHVNAWLRTEYDTAIRRAHRAAEMRQFIAEADVFPNIEWLPSTAVNPREAHMPFYHHIWPINDPFWDEHKPGDEWGCQCGWESTDKPATDNKGLGGEGVAEPSPGLGGNPAKTGQVFSDDHPYFPSDCAHCGIYNTSIKNRLASVFYDRKKDCYNCPYIRGCIARLSSDGYKLEKKFDGGGLLYIHPNVEKKKADYRSLKTIGVELARSGHMVKLNPVAHFLSEDYRRIFGELIDTKYYKKCPDLFIDGKLYEYEGYSGQWKKSKVGRMLSHGAIQCPRIIINNTNGCSDRYIRKNIIDRKHTGTAIDEVWLYEKGKIRLFYKDGKFYKNNGGK